MQLGPIKVGFHRTVRVADGRTPAALPPSLGLMQAHPVSKYRCNCPAQWSNHSYFMALHDIEAMWIAFHSIDGPAAILAGAGGINALTGEKLGTTLEHGNYIVAPPQPWLDGWKGRDGSVYQFVATPYQGGAGTTVAEQLIGSESVTGAIALAVFGPKMPLVTKPKPDEYFTKTPCSAGPPLFANPLHRRASVAKGVIRSAARHLTEIGIGKGGRITQKIYPDPYGIQVWREQPTALLAVYLVDARTAEEITGEKVPIPAHESKYVGPWYGLNDHASDDVPGTGKFDTIKTSEDVAAANTAALDSGAFTGER